MGMPLENLFCLEQGYACINILHADAEACRVMAMNLMLDQFPQ
jgi:hypothetical protein